MIAFQIQDIKAFTTALFLGETFDCFLVHEAEIVTFNTFTIQGAVHRSYYSAAELENGSIEAYSVWRVLRPFCFSLIKGQKLPERFSIILQLPKKQTEHFLRERCSSYSPEQIGGLYLNIRYEDHTLTAITGVSLNEFTLDKTLEREWDDQIRTFFKTHQLPVTAV